MQHLAPLLDLAFKQYRSFAEPVPNVRIADNPLRTLLPGAASEAILSSLRVVYPIG
jgi:hypothetical protein